MKTATNKRLLISKSRGDSNRCTPCRAKPDQHDTYASRASPRTPDVRFLRVVPVRGNLPRAADRVGWSHCSREKRAPDTIPSTPADRSAGLYPVSLPSQPMKQWRKPNIHQQQDTRFTGPILPACDRYVQYLLTRANRIVLNRHRQGLQPWRCRLAAYPLPDLPNQLSPLSPSGSARSPF
jgi:hypothetical protein